MAQSERGKAGESPEIKIPGLQIYRVVRRGPPPGFPSKHSRQSEKENDDDDQEYFVYITHESKIKNGCNDLFTLSLYHIAIISLPRTLLTGFTQPYFFPL